MGWPGNWVDQARDWVEEARKEAQRAADNAYNEFKRGLHEAATASDSLGSAKYMNPVTLPFALYGDYERGQENKERDEQAAKDAEAQYKRSLQDIDAIGDYQDLIAKDFAEHKDKYTGLLQDADKRTLRNQLSDTLKNVSDDYNHRGLLRSGGEKAAKAKANAQALGAIQQSDYQNAQIIDNQLRDYQNQALKTHTAAQGGQAANDLSQYQQALANMQAKNKTYSQLGQAGGQIAGTYLANQNKGT